MSAQPSSFDRTEPPDLDEKSAFESALRRDLARAPPVAYEAHVGGPAKRAFDLVVTAFLLPAWGLALLLAFAWALERGVAPIVSLDTRVGYGGRTFRLMRLCLDRPASKQDVGDEAPADLSAVARFKGARSDVRRVLERLPQLIDVLRGTMSLVGPSPLTREQVEHLRSARRAYLSARPGVIGLGGEASEENSTLYRAYAASWSFGADFTIMSAALRGLRSRGRLWQPKPRKGSP